MIKSNRVPLFVGAIAVVLGMGLMGARSVGAGDAAGVEAVKAGERGAPGMVGGDAADRGVGAGDAAGVEAVKAGETGGRGVGAVKAGEVDKTGKGEIAWMRLEEAAGKLQKEQRPVLIDLYTSWCGWCKQMDKKTYSNKNVAAYLQEKFYPVKLDAETHDVVSWNGRDYRFNPGYKSNEIAVYLTRGRLEFPTTIIIPPGGEPQAIPGYMEPKELELLVKYFGEGMYNKMSFDQYQKSFKASW